MIHDVEVLNVLAHTLYGTAYRRKEIDNIWKTILLYVIICLFVVVVI